MFNYTDNNGGRRLYTHTHLLEDLDYAPIIIIIIIIIRWEERRRPSAVAVLAVERHGAAARPQFSFNGRHAAYTVRLYVCVCVCK